MPYLKLHRSNIKLLLHFFKNIRLCMTINANFIKLGSYRFEHNFLRLELVRRYQPPTCKSRKAEQGKIILDNIRGRKSLKHY